MDEKAKVHGKDFVKRLPKIVQKEGMLYNPINNKVEDQERMQAKDRRDKMLKQRYSVKYDAEYDLRLRGLADVHKSEMQKVNRMNYNKYMDFLERGLII